METAKIVEIIDSLPEKKREEAEDFLRFLKFQAAKERLMASNSEARLTFENIDELMYAIDNVD